MARQHVTIRPSPEQFARWQTWADHFRRPLPGFVVFVMDSAVRYFREMERMHRTDLDEVGLRIGQRDKLRSLVEQARDALDKLAEALR